MHFAVARTNEIPCPSSFFHQGNIRCANLSRKQSQFRKKLKFPAKLNVFDGMAAVMALQRNHHECGQAWVWSQAQIALSVIKVSLQLGTAIFGAGVSRRNTRESN